MECVVHQTPALYVDVILANKYSVTMDTMDQHVMSLVATVCWLMIHLFVRVVVLVLELTHALAIHTLMVLCARK